MVGEIACGSLADRSLVLSLLQQLPKASTTEPDEVLGYIERHRLYGKGIGYVDVHLLCSAAISGARIWTFDKNLLVAAENLGLVLAKQS